VLAAELLEARTLLTGLSWSAGPSLSAPLGNAAALETTQGVLLVGGATSATGTTTPATAQFLDPTSNTWIGAPASDQGRNGGGIGATGSYGPTTSDGYKYVSDVFQFGGANQGQATASTYNYNLYNNSNAGDSGNAPSMSTARSDFADATDPATGDLYAIGGLNSSNHAIATAEVYDPRADAWSPIASLPQPLSGASASSDGAGHILVFGGTNSVGAPVNTVYSYTIVSNTWTALSSMPIAESGTAAVFGAYGQVYVIGGRTTGGAVPNVYIYNPVTDQWTADAPLPSALYDVAAAIDSNGNLDVIGGFNAAGAAVTTVYDSPVLPAPVGLPVVPTVTFDTNWYRYDSTPHAVVASVYGTDGVTPVSGTMTFTYNGSATLPVNAGTYNVLSYFTSNDPNYVNTVTPGVLYIAAANPTLSVSGGGTITYDGLSHAIRATAIGVDGTTPISGAFTYTYNGSATAPVNPGSYTAIANFASSDPNYVSSSASTTITIPDPTIPTGVSAVGASTTSVQVSWNPVAGADHYNVYRREVVHSPKGSGATIYWVAVAGNVTGTSATINVGYFGSGTFYVTSVSTSGVQSPPSALVSAQALYAPSLASMLWGGAVTSYASVEYGQTLHVTLLGYGNLPPTYSMVSGPAGMSLDQQTGIVTFTPTTNAPANFSATFTATNSVGSSTATFSFHVLAQPTVQVTGGTFAYDGNTHGATAVAYGIDGVTPIAGTFNILYAPAAYPTAQSTAPYAGIGTYIVSATFTSSDPNYGGASGTATITINPATSQVLSRLLFYDNSKYDGNAPGVSASDATAIATDKSAYLPGSGAATFANVSSYTRGINGIMVDISGSHPGIGLNDFTFKVGNNNTPSTWGTAPAPISVTVLPGGGVGGSDRVELIWADNAIQEQWLEIIVAANANTGLAAPDTFFFASAIGDSGMGDTTAATTDTLNDELGARGNPKSLLDNIPITNIYDYNRDGKVDVIGDVLAARGNLTSNLNAPKFLNIGSPPAAPVIILTTNPDEGLGAALSLTPASTIPNDLDWPSPDRQAGSPPTRPQKR